jgi:hypothetical protein
MIIKTKDRGPLKARVVLFTPKSSHDMIIEWESGDVEYMRLHEVDYIRSEEAPTK